ncbi:hypothetical protein GCM10009030_30980 [Haloarcula pellucida]|uniref:Uncharacterized protein n=1 Tax=Haloarcula pellucida TaxID=1427151 RepID=A0A830GSE6_9EURY|nr:hypothetical protein GCM10009030_30980 [Halomicroarcula pellucida]
MTVEVTAHHVSNVGVWRPPYLIDGRNSEPEVALDVTNATIKPHTSVITESANTTNDAYWRWDERQQNVTLQLPIVVPRDAHPGLYKYRLVADAGEPGWSESEVVNGTVRVSNASRR